MGFRFLRLPVLLLTTLTVALAGTPVAYQWHTFYNNPLANGYIDAVSTAIDPGGNIYVAGTCGAHNEFECWPGSVHAGDSGTLFYVMKLAPNGTRLWHAIFNGSAHSLTLDPGGSVYVAGAGVPNGPNGKNPNYGTGLFLVKLDTATGAYLWHTTWGGFACGLQANGMVYDPQHAYVYITGQTDCDFGYSGLSSPVPTNPFPGAKSMYILQVSSLGFFGWYGYFSTGGYAHATAIAMDASGDFYVAGDDPSAGHDSLAVWKLRYSAGATPPTSASVQTLWRFNTGAATAKALALDPSGNVYITGDTPCFNGPSGEAPLHASRCNAFAHDLMVMKLDTAGNYRWHTFYYPPGGNSISGAGIALDGWNVYVTGMTTADLVAPAASLHTSAINAGHYLMQLDISGAYQWHTVYGDGSYADLSRAISIDSGHNVVLAGSTAGAWYGDGNALPLQPQANLSMWVMRFTATAPTVTTAANAAATYSPVAQTVTLTAAVTTSGGTVNSGSVAFTLFGATVTGSVSSGSATASATIPAGTAPGSYTIQAVYTPGAGFGASSDASHMLSIGKATPVVSWANPADIPFGTVLSSTQLNATADVPGNFAYTPAAGTILAPGSSQLLTVVFTPTSSYYFTRSATARINVLPAAVQLSITRTLTRNGDGSIRLAVTLSNTGGSTAQNVQITAAKIGTTAGTPLPLWIGNIAAGGTASGALTFASSAGAPGAAALSLAGSYTGGTFNSTSRVVLP